jgi:hypothetical protein
MPWSPVKSTFLLVVALAPSGTVTSYLIGGKVTDVPQRHWLRFVVALCLYLVRSAVESTKADTDREHTAFLRSLEPENVSHTYKAFARDHGLSPLDAPDTCAMPVSL